MQEEEKIEIDERNNTFNRLRMKLKKDHRDIFYLKLWDEMDMK